jgi:hypothetical protein
MPVFPCVRTSVLEVSIKDTGDHARCRRCGLWTVVLAARVPVCELVSSERPIKDTGDHAGFPCVRTSVLEVSIKDTGDHARCWAASSDCGTSCKIRADRANACQIGNADAWATHTIMKRKETTVGWKRGFVQTVVSNDWRMKFPFTKTIRIYIYLYNMYAFRRKVLNYEFLKEVAWRSKPTR